MLSYFSSEEEEEAELPGCWTAGWPPLQSDLPSPGPSMESELAELVPTQNCCKQEIVLNPETASRDLTYLGGGGGGAFQLFPPQLPGGGGPQDLPPGGGGGG